jgi:tetratricopeptide (TPR) repeat protein
MGTGMTKKPRSCPAPSWLHWCSMALGVAAMFVSLETRAGVSAKTETPRLGMGGSTMWDGEAGSLLIDYFESFLLERDIELFRQRVAARYTEGTLGRILSNSPVVAARRAAALSLGLVGSFEQSNAVLGKALRDGDGVVRETAENALWSIWFNADTPENNQKLDRVRQAISRHRLDQAEALVNGLIVTAPNFIEAHNQRAIIFFLQGRFAESAHECQDVVGRNPYHIGAISGLAQCQLRLNRAVDALKTLRRALKLQPYNDSLRQSIEALEAAIEPDGSR